MSKIDDALLAKLSLLSPAQRDALLQKLQAKKTTTKLSPGMTAITRSEKYYPLSFAQQRLWFLEQLSDSHASYNIAAAFHLKGHLRTDLLDTALQHIIQKHESLRTVFASGAEGARQMVLDHIDWHLPIEAIDNTPAAIKLHIHNEANQRFDLSTAPLFRIKLFKLNDQEFILSVVLHHIISDAWSSQLLLNEVSGCYSRLIQGEPLPAITNTLQYIDFAIWQKQLIDDAGSQQQLQYWQEQLADFSNLDLPIDNNRPNISTYNGAVYRTHINAVHCEQLQLWCKTHQITLFSALLASYQILLYRYTQQNNFCVGIPIANRHHTDTEHIMGFFVNSLAIKCDAYEGRHFADVANRVQKRILDAQSHQDIPFEVLVTQLSSLERNPAINPVFQTFFTLTQDNIDTGLQLSNVKSEYIPADIEGTKFDLSLNMRQLGDTLECHFEYNRDLFNTDTIVQLADNFIHLSKLLYSNDKSNIDTLPFINPQQYQQQLNFTHGWNATQFEYPPCTAVHELFEQQCLRTPDSIAVSDDNHTLTYHELNQQSNQLAHYLISKGICVKQPVAVSLERSISMSVALLAILKAGGAYVPIATDLPIERIRFICHDINTPFLIAESQHHLGGINIPLLSVSHNHLWQNFPASNPALQHQGTDLFNIIYTSGSTGTPKGVMVPHQGIINRLRWMQHEYYLTPADTVLQKTPYNFDVSVWELFWPLLYGARLHFAKPDGHKDPDYLRECIKNCNITFLHFVPSMLGLFLQTQGIAQCTQLRKVFTSGEALKTEQANAFFEYLPHAELHNLYGPTEASIDVSYYPCKPHDQHRSIPIGKPIHNIQLHILDKHLQILPAGATGELYIGGIGLALGYWNQQTLTDQHFIDNPFFKHGHPSSKLYKTGDLARYLPDGNIEYLGRNDFQVKIRGFRIELGEIESQCRKLPNIEDAVVIHRNTYNQSQLIAYLVTRQPLLETATYHSLLKLHLPDYMLPTSFAAIAALPLSPNGKIDRKQLPEVDLASLQQHAFVAPRNDIEEALARFWMELLHQSSVGIYDNFFELGGHSLLAAQLLTRIREHFLIELPLRTLFEVNTIEGLAKIISALSFAADTANQTNDDDFEEGSL